MSLILVIFFYPDILYKEYIKNIMQHQLSSFKVKRPSILFYFHENHLEHKFLSVRQKRLPMDNLQRLYDNLTDSARKGNRKEVLANYNKTRINIDYQHDSWMELKEALRVQIHAEVYTSVPLCM